MTKYKELYLFVDEKNKELWKGIKRLKKSQLKYKELYEKMLPEYQKMQQDIFNLSTENIKLRKTVGIIEEYKILKNIN